MTNYFFKFYLINVDKTTWVLYLQYIKKHTSGLVLKFHTCPIPDGFLKNVLPCNNDFCQYYC